MRKTPKQLACLPALVMLGACHQHFYRPRPNDPAMLTHRGESKFVLGSTGSNFFGSAAWSPIKHLGLQAGYCGGHGDSKGTDDLLPTEKRAQYFLSAGYYHSLSKGLSLEAYVGADGVHYDYKSEVPVQRLRLAGYFIQPALVIEEPDYKVAFSLRYDQLNRGETVVSNAPDAIKLDGIHSFLKYKQYHVLQPGLTFSAGGRVVRGQVEVYMSYMLNNDYESLYGGVTTNGVLRTSLGLVLNLGELRKKQ